MSSNPIWNSQFFSESLYVISFSLFSDPPTITKPQNNIFNVTAGDDVNITCEAEGNPDPHFVWTNVTSGDNITNDGHLHLRQVYDSGNYTCIANNLLGSAFITVLVKVRSKSNFSVLEYNFMQRTGLERLSH